MKNLLTVLLCVITFSTQFHAQISPGAYVSAQDKRLYLINPNNCQATVIGNTGESFIDIAIDPISGLMYGATNSKLFIINPTNANVTFIADLDEAFNALTIGEDGTMYAAIQSSDEIFTINKTTGQSTSLGSTTTGVVSGGDLTFFNGDLYWSGNNDELVKVNLSNISNSTIVGDFIGSTERIFGILTITQNCNTNVFAFGGEQMYKLDPNDLTFAAIHCANIIPSPIFGAASISESINNYSPNLIGLDTTICKGESLVLNAENGFANAYNWSTGATSASITIEEAGIYTVTLTTNECDLIDSIDIQTETCPDILNFPNVFSPNNDEFNNVFTAKEVSGIKSLDIQIFNRWGEKVFASTAKDFKWNGENLSGNRVSEGIYYWTASYSDLESNQKETSGYITILK